MPIDKIEEFAKNGQKSTEGIILENGFPQEEKPARQWFNYILNSQAVKTNEVIDITNSLQDAVDAINLDLDFFKLDTGITVTPKLTGQVEITQAVKNAQTVSVKEWGIKSSTTLDQTAKIQQALDNVPLGTVLEFNYGNYVISQQLVVSRPITVVFKGAKFLPVVGFTQKSVVRITSHNVTLEGIDIAGANLPVPTNISDIKGFGLEVIGTSANRLENVRIIRGYIKDTPFSAIYAEHTKNISIIDFESFNCSTAITSFTLGTVTIADSYAPKVIRYRANSPVNKGVYYDNCTGGVIAFCNVYDAYLSSAYYNKNCRNSVIIGNYGENIRNNAVDSSEGGGLKLSRGNVNMIVSKNQFVNCAVVLQGSKHVLFEGNIFNQSESDALHIMSHGTYQQDVEDIVVQNNIFNMNDTNATNRLVAITLNSSEGFSCRNIVIRGNAINNAGIGIYTKTLVFGQSQYTDISIEGNILSNTTTTCIDIGSFKNLAVTSNRFDGAGAGSLSSGLTCRGYTTNSIDVGYVNIKDNKFNGFGTGNALQVRDFLSDTVSITDNYLDGNNIGIYFRGYTKSLNLNNNYVKNSSSGAGIQLVNTQAASKTQVIIEDNVSDKKLLMTDFGASIGRYSNNDLVFDSRTVGRPDFYTTTMSPDLSVWKIRVDNAGVITASKT